MMISKRKKIVLLGMMSRMPVAGNIWLVVHYMLGFQRLGYDPYYVEAHARTPTMLMEHEDDDSSAIAAEFIGGVMKRFDLHEHWAFHALHDDDRCFGMHETQLNELYRSADLILNLHGGTVPLAEHAATGRLVYLETDPVELEIELYNGDKKAIEFLEPHVAFFTWGLNFGNPDCKVPLPERFKFRPSPPVVVSDLWEQENGAGELFTTIGNWKQSGEVSYKGEMYSWSKHHEFLKFLEVPTRTGQAFELALSGSSYTAADRSLLEDNGWQVRDALDFSKDVDSYRDYIRGSRGEFTVAKDQNIRLRSGWFSERSAQYLAAGRPVITQETGFSNVLPTGRGLFAFSTMDDILAAVDSINSDYEGHCCAAAELAREYFNYDIVLRQLLDNVGI